MTVLPARARAMWLRKFAKPCRVTEWAATRPSIPAARVSLPVAEQVFEDLVVPQVGELLICETEALGAAVPIGTTLLHDGALLEVSGGPHEFQSDRSWHVFSIVPRRAQR